MRKSMSIEEIKELYPERIDFSKHIDGSEPWPRSTNVACVGWSESNPFPLLVEYWGYVSTKTGAIAKNRVYLFKADAGLWAKLVAVVAQKESIGELVVSETAGLEYVRVV